MNVNEKDKKEERREYGRAYYWKNIDTIKQKYREQADVANASKRIRREDLVMLTEWSKKLQNRLKDEDISGWLLWAIKLTITKINDKIDELNGKECRTADKEDRTPGV